MNRHLCYAFVPPRNRNHFLRGPEGDYPMLHLAIEGLLCWGGGGSTPWRVDTRIRDAHNGLRKVTHGPFRERPLPHL